MFHDALNEMGDNTLHNLLGKLSHAGFIVKHADKSVVSDTDLADAWDQYHNKGPDAAVAYLETMFGFIFDQGEAT